MASSCLVDQHDQILFDRSSLAKTGRKFAETEVGLFGRAPGYLAFKFSSYLSGDGDQLDCVAEGCRGEVVVPRVWSSQRRDVVCGD